MTTLDAYLAARPDRCPLGFHLSQHPHFCGCTDMSEWAVFLAAVRAVVRDDGTVHQCDVRPKIRGRIQPKHVGILWRRAKSEGLVAEAGHERSDDLAGRNAGRMEPYYSWAPAVSEVAA